MTNVELKALRRQLNLTQAALAEKLEISVNSLARYEMPSNQGRYTVPKWLVRELDRLLHDATLDARKEDQP